METGAGSRPDPCASSTRVWADPDHSRDAQRGCHRTDTPDGTSRAGRRAMLERTLTAAGGPAIRVRAVTLYVTRGRDAGRSVRVDRPAFVIGTGETADLRLTDPAVSREHVWLALGTSGVRLRDTSSKNGTSLAGVRVREVTITHDTTIVLGTTTIV